MAKQCTGSLEAVRLRIGLLAPNGAPLAGASSLVVSSLIKLDWRVVLKAGAQLELEDGAGNICATFQGRDKVKSVDLTMELCQLDAEQIELMTGGGLVTVGGESVGWTLPDVNEEIDREVSVEAWSLAWDGDEQATDGADLLYHHWVWPRTTWTFGDGGISNDFLRVPLVGHGTSNANFGDGPANDLPWGVFTTPMGEFVDDQPPPEAACGYQTLTAS